MALPQKLGVLGCGNMGEAIVRALVRARPDVRVVAFDPSPARRAAMADLPAVRFAENAAAVAAECEALLLAVKPQAMGALLAEIAAHAAGRLLVSIAAGVTTARIESAVPGARVVRTMPNTPLLAGKGVVALCPGASAAVEDMAVARALFPGAALLETREALMDATTAVSGSGPAYFYAFVEALAAAAEAEGFDRETAGALAAGTFTGAAALLESSGVPAAELRRRVTSPGGTTEAALRVFEERDFAGTIRAAVAAATARGKALGH